MTRLQPVQDAETFLPYRRLAVRVIGQALRDAADGARSTNRKSARAFLAGSSMLRLWCEVARLDSRWMTAGAGALRAGCMRSSSPTFRDRS